MENWKPIPGYPHYEASDEGRVRSVPRTGMNRGRVTRYEGKVLKPGFSGKPVPYMKVTIVNAAGKRKTVPVHRLVMMAHGRLTPSLEVDHIDTDTANNRIDNLRMVTRQQNQEHARNLGRQRCQALDWVKVSEIRRRYSAGEGQQSLADSFGVGQMTISDLLRGATWNRNI
jgi:hypothetical protein